MWFKSMCFGLIGFCFFGADRALAQHVPGAAPAGMYRGSTLNNNDQRIKDLNDRLKTAKDNAAKARKKRDDREKELADGDKKRGTNHVPGHSNYGNGREKDAQYDKLDNAYKDAVKTQKGLEEQIKSAKEGRK